MSFLYFFPGHAGPVRRADFDARGLRYALTGGDPDSRAVVKGPGDVDGVVAAAQPFAGQPVEVAYVPDRQTWRKGPDKWVEGKPLACWVGFWNDAPPGPAALARQKIIAGDSVRLRDGNEWTIPIARSVVRGSTLPKELVLGEDLQSWSPQDLPEYLVLCRDAEKAFAWLHGGEPDGEGNVVVTIPYTDGMRVAVAALAVSYRVSAIEAALLRLFGDAEMEAVLKAVCDFTAYEQMHAAQKKSGLASAT